MGLNMTSHEIRRAFLNYFAARGHRQVASSPLVLPNDPTLLFANAGMNQFKDVFTGRDERDYQRATSSQKCLRVSGKHNDLETVGRTPRHHTFFEMLGNFSFGDYFKKDAIAYAWELLTEVYALPPDLLWITVFKGTGELPPDEEAAAIWRDQIGVPAERILHLGEKENFWRMGDSGPCGPCSEIHFDLGEHLTSVSGPCTPETDERRFLEIWNLVFMQFDQNIDGKLTSLPAPSIDTGMGLERISSVLQGKLSNYDTDLFVPLLAAAAKRAGVLYGQDPETDFSLRVIADHARAFCFLVADGVVPANDKRGYVMRRLLRRAIRHARKLGIDEPFLHEITPIVVEELGAVYPELLASQSAVREIGRIEEQRFSETLAAGLVVLEDAIAALDRSHGNEVRLPGKELFKLYDTFGFPIDLARDIAEERGIQLDEEGFESEMAKQRSRAQASWKQGAVAESAAAYQELLGSGCSSFDGYERSRLDAAKVVALVRAGNLVDTLSEGEEGEIILDRTPFYAEAGGQVADTGYLNAPLGRAVVKDVRMPARGLIVHQVLQETGSISTGAELSAEIDASRRQAIRRNHTATHLLHAALREVVGMHVKQAGSLVAPDKLRFDFSHFAPLTDRAQADIESLINREVLEDQPVESDVMAIDEALGLGAMALFGEKYGNEVRTVKIGRFSLELCGGTHCARTGEIGLVKLVQERGIASGVRRIEAVSGLGSLELFREEHALLRAMEEQLSVPRGKVFLEFERRLEQMRELQKELGRHRKHLVREQLSQKVAEAESVAGVRVFAHRVDDMDPQEMRELADDLRRDLPSGVVVLGRSSGGKASLLVAVTDDLKKRLPAGDLVKALGKIIGGGGGGRPDMAEAGGKNPERLEEALQQAAHLVRQRMESQA
jgi:alanyl-tRNA synthetase